MKVALSSGHGLIVRGAAGHPIPPCMDEVNEVRRLSERVADYLEEAGVEVAGPFHDNTSSDVTTNLNTICSWHNNSAFGGGAHDYDISFHMNAYDGNAHGTEVLYVSDAGKALATPLSAAIAAAGPFTNRGPKLRTDLKFLNSTREVAVLLETAFCDHAGDCTTLAAKFEEVARAIASTVSGQAIGDVPPETETPPVTPPGAVFSVRGRMSTFGGPGDTSGVSPSEGLAFIYSYDAEPEHQFLFLPQQPPGTTGLARRLNPGVFYVACRWPYERPGCSKADLQRPSVQALVRAGDTAYLAAPADWGPNEQETGGRVADLSPALAAALGLVTDDECEVIYPAPAWGEEDV